MRTREYIQYGITGPFLNRSVPENQVNAGSFGNLVGVDNRYTGCLRKFYGMKEVLDLDDVTGMGDIDLYSGPSFVRYVVFHKKGTSDIYRGFVVRWDSEDSLTDQSVDLIYTVNGTVWAKHSIWEGGATPSNGITSSLEMDCATHEGFLFVAVDTKTPKTVYWNGSSLVTVDMGPGAFSSTLAALTTNTSSTDTAYNLKGDGRFQVAYRFYDSNRGIYSALSSPVTVTLDIMKQTKATGSLAFSDKLTAGDIITINGRTYEYIDAGSNVTIPVAGTDTVAGHCSALANAINGDSSAVVYATAGLTTVSLEAKTRGSDGNAYTLVSSTVNVVASSTTLTGGGVPTTEPEDYCKAVLDFPAHGSVLSTYDYDDFSVLFNKVDVFRTINLGNSVNSTGAIFYLEQTLDMPANSGAWDSLQVTIGTLIDEALPFQTQYNPETDVIGSPPASGTIARYQDTTFMAQARSNRGGVDTLFSSFEHQSPEYFTTFNDRRGSMGEGRPLRCMVAGDVMFILSSSAVVHVFKSSASGTIQFTTLHQERGLAGKEAAHTIGNSILMLSGPGLILLNGSDGSMGQISAVDRLLFDDWAGDWGTIKSGYDSLTNTSYFLHPTDMEVLQVSHSTQSSSMLEGANFVGVTSGPDPVALSNVRAYFVNSKGLIVVPDVDQSGSGTMWGLSASYTLNGTVTTASSAKTHIIQSGATFHADMVGALVYMTSGANAGIARAITSVSTGDLTVSAFPSAIAIGDRYAISPVPFKVRFWPLRDQSWDRTEQGAMDMFGRWITSGITIKAREISGFTTNANNKWRVGFYRNSGDELETTTEITVSSNPSDSAGRVSSDGIDVEPYVEQISSGTTFELTNIEVTAVETRSKKNTA